MEQVYNLIQENGRFVGAVLAEQADEWAKDDASYFDLKKSGRGGA